MRVLVTGGAGFIGRSLCRRLVDEGSDVVVLDDRSSSSPAPDLVEVQYIEGSVVDPPNLEGRFDEIFHLASVASPPRYLADPIGTLRSNGEGTRRMLDVASRDDASFIFSSTSEIYGDPLEHPQSETYFGNVDTTSPRSCYDEGKRYGEALVTAYRRTGRVERTRIARIFNTYGPGMAPDDGRIVTNFLAQALRGQPLTVYGDGSQTRSFCFVEDLVEGLLLLGRSNFADPVNLGNPREVTVKALADLVADLLGDTGRVHESLPVGDPTRRRPDISLANAVLGWQPTTTLEDGLPRTAEYLASLIEASDE